jgi:DNA mismatch repair protein MutL
MLKVLPDYIYNLIAAGEVIQRPASVVKELLENSADAGASSIMLVINDCGRTLIQVIDDGVGMTEEESKLCFLSHATSKIDTAEDLQHITTFGFRGEALASIAACADVTLKTRKRGEEVGTEVHIAASTMDKVEKTSCPEGCNIAVRNIFYNIPARRKFLKSDNSEYKQIIAEFIRVALTRLDLEFKLISNSREAMHLTPVKNLKQRIAQISGLSVVKQLIDLQIDTRVVKISGYIGSPESAKKVQQNQYFFANGRFFRNAFLRKALLEGYSNLIPDGNTPSFFVFFEVTPEETDVNIHPSKTEIKFENERVIFEILEAAVKEAIGKNAFAPTIDFDNEGVPQEISSKDGFTMSKEEREKYRAGAMRAPQENYNPLFNPFEPDAYGKSNKNEKGTVGIQDNITANQIIREGEGRKFLQIKGEFLVTPSDEGLLLIDIKRARGKILYENYLKTLVNAKPAIQEELFPKTVDLDHASFSVLMNNAEKLKDLGFDIREFGKDCIVVYGTPSDFKGEKFNVEDLISEIAETLTEETDTSANEEAGENGFKKEFKEKIAMEALRHYNCSAQNAMTDAEANALIETLLSCKNSAIYPLGGYCITTITAEELKKKLS